MAENLKPSNLLFIFFTFSLLLTSQSTPSSQQQLTSLDLEAAIFALRANGFDLFANSIAVSDLSFQLLTHTFNSTSISGGGSTTTTTIIGRHGFTFLAPPNSVLFSLDMSTDAFTYVHSLRFHVVPRRLSFSDLRNVSLSSKPQLETLVRGHNLFVSSSGTRIVSIDGVRVSFPDLYLSSDIAVHGLDGIFVSSNDEFFHRLDSVASPPPIQTLTPTPTPTLAPSIDAFSPIIGPASAPTDAFSPIIEGVSPPIDALSPNFASIPPFSHEFEGVPPYAQDFEGIAPYFHHFAGILEDLSPVSAFPPEFGAIPPSHDAPFTGGSFDSISVPPIVAYPPKNDGIPATSPESDTRIPATAPSTEFSSSDAHSIAPTHAEWSGAESWLPDWNAPQPPFPVEEWQEYWDSINDHQKPKTRTKLRAKANPRTRTKTKTKKQIKMREKKKHHLERGHGYGEMYTEYYTEVEEREN